MGLIANPSGAGVTAAFNISGANTCATVPPCVPIGCFLLTDGDGCYTANFTVPGMTVNVGVNDFAPPGTISPSAHTYFTCTSSSVDFSLLLKNLLPTTGSVGGDWVGAVPQCIYATQLSSGSFTISYGSGYTDVGEIPFPTGFSPIYGTGGDENLGGFSYQTSTPSVNSDVYAELVLNDPIRACAYLKIQGIVPAQATVTNYFDTYRYALTSKVNGYIGFTGYCYWLAGATIPGTIYIGGTPSLGTGLVVPGIPLATGLGNSVVAGAQDYQINFEVTSQNSPGGSFRNDGGAYGLTWVSPITVSVSTADCNGTSGTMANCNASNGSTGNCAPTNCSGGVLQLGPNGTFSPTYDCNVTILINVPPAVANASTGSFSGSFGGTPIVLAARNTQSVSIPIKACQTYSYSFSGSFADGTGYIGGPGGNTSFNAEDPAPGLKYASVIAIVTCCGPPCFLIGTSKTYTAECDGFVCALFNDTIGAYADNTGSFSLDVSDGTTTINYTVPGNSATGVPFQVSAGTTYTLTATGTVGNGTGETFGPNGNASNNSVLPFTNCLLANYGSLIGIFNPGNACPLTGPCTNGVPCDTVDDTTSYTVTGELWTYAYNSSTGGIDAFDAGPLETTITGSGNNWTSASFNISSPAFSGHISNASLLAFLAGNPLDGGTTGAWGIAVATDGFDGFTTAAYKFCGSALANGSDAYISATPAAGTGQITTDPARANLVSEFFTDAGTSGCNACVNTETPHLVVLTNVVIE